MPPLRFLQSFAARAAHFRIIFETGCTALRRCCLIVYVVCRAVHFRHR